MAGKGAATGVLVTRMRVCISYFPTVAIVPPPWPGQLTEERVRLDLEFQRIEQRQKAAAMAVGTRRWGLISSLKTQSGERQRQRRERQERSGNGGWLWKLVTCLQWRTSSSKASLSKPTQKASPARDQVFKHLNLCRIFSLKPPQGPPWHQAGNTLHVVRASRPYGAGMEERLCHIPPWSAWKHAGTL